jgi:cyclase
MAHTIARTMDRRQLLAAVVGGALGSVILPRRAAAQRPGIVPLTDRLSLVTTGGTNVLAHTGSSGLVVVDTGRPELAGALTASLQPLGASISTAFNTHFHLENTGGNEAVRRAGAAIVAHENTRLWMATPTWMPAEDRYSKPRPQAAHPTKTFRVDGSMEIDRERIEYGYLIEAHTSGDIYVFFRNANVIAVGDVASPARDPELDYLTGAWLGGRVDAMSRLLKITDDKTRIVPGSGPVMSRAELQSERDMMKTIYDRAVDRVRQSDTADDMLSSGVLGGLPRTFKDPKRFLYTVQKGLWAHHNKLNPNVV